MKKYTKAEKETIFNRLSKDGESPFKVAEELGIELADLMDITVEVLTKKKNNGKTNDVPETSLNDADDTVESTNAAKTVKSDKKAKPVADATSNNKEKAPKETAPAVKWSDKLGFGGNFVTVTETTIVQKAPEQEPVKKAVEEPVKETVEEPVKETVEPEQVAERIKKAANFVEPKVISVDKLGALAYRLSKLHMSEDTIVKVLNIVLGVPEPTIREALA